MHKFMQLSLVGLFAFLHGCSASHPNQPLERFDTSAGYRFDSLAMGPKNSDDVFVCLTFSGGGTRAAAFAYGVLTGLRDTPITEGGSRRLLDEVDLISSVSGGSFTAMGKPCRSFVKATRGWFVAGWKSVISSVCGSGWTTCCR